MRNVNETPFDVYQKLNVKELVCLKLEKNES
jgi:hypothetical protein